MWWPAEAVGITADAALLDVCKTELSQFPNSKNDDFADATGYSAIVLFQYVIPPMGTEPTPSATQDAVTVATDLPHGFNPATAIW